MKLIRRFLIALASRMAGYDFSGVTKAGYERVCGGFDFSGATHVGAYNYSVKLTIKKGGAEPTKHRTSSVRG